MKLTAPIFILRQHAKALSRKDKIPLHQALDRIASREGFNAWSLLAAKAGSDRPGETFLERLSPGDLALIAGRPGQGKTLFSLKLAVETMRRGNRAAFFTLVSTRAHIGAYLEVIDEKRSSLADMLLIDDSDQICADYIAARLESAPEKMLVIIDYLQLLDQRRINASIADQMRRLKALADERGLIIVFLSQIDRRYDVSRQPFPGFEDLRLPNPLDIGVFTHACFLSGGRIAISGAPV
jgi:replicative DNA helicase